PGISQREGFCKYFDCPATSTIICTVPAGRRFVLRKLCVSSDSIEWRIDGGPNLSIRHHINKTKFVTGTDTYHEYTLMHDFPDACVVVEGPNDLTFIHDSGNSIGTHFVGYFYDVP
ncbi:MAG: hypothetical protein ACYS9Y_11225, partial [Planctomycetota bacterium]